MRRCCFVSASFSNRGCSECFLSASLEVARKASRSAAFEERLPKATGRSPDEAGPSPSVSGVGAFVAVKATFTSDGVRGLLGGTAVEVGLLSPFARADGAAEDQEVGTSGRVGRAAVDSKLEGLEEDIRGESSSESARQRV
ncbi:hypothetical protein LSCM4_03225 [Leishmania orientalis]|uniref:Uncharacterized protein n=1 Tax=Leishmania orientalis TaxID=2249476 RepID=A0A836H7U8_9TRYP|nr:hypothetical protein LSCM4_03225 [Leishmania orientalis]